MNADLSVVVTDAAGNTKTLDSDAPDPADRPRGIQCGTQIQSGFYTSSFNLRRAIDRDNIDLHLGDDIKIVGAGGDTAYEGFVQSLPRSMDETSHTLSVTTAGWMAHASDEPFSGIIIDRDLGAWGPMSRARRAALLAAPVIPGDPTSAPDSSTGASAVILSINSPTARNITEALYDAGPASKIATLVYSGNRTNVGAAPYDLRIYNGDSDTTYANSSANLATGAGAVAGTYTPATTGRFVHLLLDNGAGVDVLAHEVAFTQLVAIGDHGLTAISVSGGADGFAASDVIKYLAGLYCPLLNTAGVQDTTYPIAQLAFRDDTTPYDAWLRVNAYHLWKLAVWEDRTLFYEPIDLTDWDWEIRHDEVGNQIGLQGDDLAGLRNGIVVQYTNAATGTVERLYPADHAELRDDSIDNPYTQHGRTVYGSPYIVPFPTIAADALELGRLQLLEDNQAKAPGSFTVAQQIKDRAGNYQPVWKVRAGDRIRLTSSANLSDRPRLIQETSYSHDGRSMTIAVDSTLRYLEAFIDRNTTALQAAGLG